MPGIAALVGSLSLDVTTELVAAGVVSPNSGWAPALAITAATVATPIVVTIPNAPQLTQAIHVVVAGCTGMTEANGTWILTPTSAGATTFTLTSWYSTAQGQYVNVAQNSVGVNPYTGGGTVTTALTDGRILLGQQHVNENVGPPRIIFTPKFSVFTGADTNDRKQGGRRPNGTAGQGQSVEQIIEQAARMVAGENINFEVTCWGVNMPDGVLTPDPDLDFDALQVLYHQVLRTLYYQVEGNYTVGRGTFVDQAEAKTQLDKLGHKMVFPLSFGTPVLDYILGTQTLKSITASVGLQIPNSSTAETAWTGTVT